MKTIAWDVDDVLNNLMEEWLKWWRTKKKIRVDISSISENPPHNILGISLNEYLQSLDEFRLSQNYQKMKPSKDVLKWLETYGDQFRHIALTATPVKTASTTAQWLFRNFGRWIRTFHFVPSKRENLVFPEYDNDKSDFVKWFGKIDIMIDDNPENIKRAKEIGLKAILWKRPWNDADKSWKQSLMEVILYDKAF